MFLFKWGCFSYFIWRVSFHACFVYSETRNALLYCWLRSPFMYLLYIIHCTCPCYRYRWLNVARARTDTLTVMSLMNNIPLVYKSEPRKPTQKCLIVIVNWFNYTVNYIDKIVFGTEYLNNNSTYNLSETTMDILCIAVMKLLLPSIGEVLYCNDNNRMWCKSYPRVIHCIYHTLYGVWEVTCAHGARTRSSYWFYKQNCRVRLWVPLTTS